MTCDKQKCWQMHRETVFVVAGAGSVYISHDLSWLMENSRFLSIISNWRYLNLKKNISS